MSFYVLAFDTANEIIALGLGAADAATKTITPVAGEHIEAHRASNTQLIPAVDAMLTRAGVARTAIACVVVGRGPGSFTGVRIAVATAKGIASALHVPLVGVGSLDAVAWEMWAADFRGRAVVLGDAMRHEVYPGAYTLTDGGVARAGTDRVLKAQAAADELAAEFGEAAACGTGGTDAEGGEELHNVPDLLMSGDAFLKYREFFACFGRVVPQEFWTPTGRGLLLAAQDLWRCGGADLTDARRHNPGYLLPVYTRLSDAEEAERDRLACNAAKNLSSGVQGEVTVRPLDATLVEACAALDRAVLSVDAWSASSLADELGRRDRTWWVAVRACSVGAAGVEVVGFAGALVCDGELDIVKVAVASEVRRRGIARTLLCRLGEDGRNLGADVASLEVRAGNVGAQAFYAAMGFADIGARPGFYPDHEDARIMKAPLPFAEKSVGGMQLEDHPTGAAAAEAAPSGDGIAAARSPKRDLSAESPVQAARGAYVHPLILAIESSCDETAGAIIDGTGRLLSDVVASQIDFHTRFGGVVPEIASRKHTEAICGVCDEAFAVAGGLDWADLDAVAVTYAPGLVGALVVGVAFGKGAAWAADKPFIGCNHLEGHLYANKLAAADFRPPAVVSLVSGGNTMLVYMEDWGVYHTLGATIDDAVGEAFDKVAKALDLGYPGGPKISKLAAAGNPRAIDFPRAMLYSHDYRFSLSGVKTAVITYIEHQRAAGGELNMPDIAASFQQAVIDVQIAKAKTALSETGAKTFCLGGGVAANPALRAAYETLCRQMNVALVMPPLKSCGDNAGMIALVALDRYRAGRFFDFDADAYAHADLDAAY